MPLELKTNFYAQVRITIKSGTVEIPDVGPEIQVLCYFAKQFHIEQELAEPQAEERYTKCLEQEEHVLEACANDLKGKIASKSALRKTLHYLIEHRPCLIRYLEDGRLEYSNNRAKRRIQPFMMGRKN